jgi:hypothetical protein
LAIVADPDPDHIGKLDPDPDPHESEKVEALGVILEHWRFQIWKTVIGRIRIRIKLKGRIQIWICMKVKSRIWICIRVMRSPTLVFDANQDPSWIGIQWNVVPGSLLESKRRDPQHWLVPS